MTQLIFLPDLRFFDGGAAGAAPAGGAGEGSPGGSQQSEVSGARETKKQGEAVVYGKPPEEPGKDAGGQPQAQTQTKVSSDAKEEKRNEYKKLVSGEYKEFYTEDTQSLINRRFKETKTLQEQLEKTKPLLDVLGQRYGATDPDQLAKAIEVDAGYWEQAAEKAGMSVSQYKEFSRLQLENARFRETVEQQEAKQQADAQLRKWYGEAEAMKAEGFPDFDLAAECENPAFIRLLKADVPVKHAYELIHLDDIKQNVAAQAAKQTEQAVVADVRARGTRPIENGVASQGGITYKSDPAKFTVKDRAEIARRVARGEKITF